MFPNGGKKNKKAQNLIAKYINESKDVVIFFFKQWIHLHAH